MNIVLISCDTLRADRLGCYGYPRPTSPHMDALAKQGALFENAFGADIPTEPVHTALFTGQLGVKTGIVAHGAHPRYLPKEAPWLPRILWETGYATAACDNLYHLKEWFARGFDDYMNTVSRRRWIDGRDVNARAQDWLLGHKKRLDRGGKAPFFLFLHYWDTHTPYLPPEPYVRQFYDGDPFASHHEGMDAVHSQPHYPFFHQYHYQHLGPVTDPKYIHALYDAEVRYLDERIGEMVHFIDDLGFGDDTLLIVMGDHGESLDEHDIYWDHAGLYDVTVKVPMIMRWPKKIRSGTRVTDMVQHVDLLPTILHAAGVAIPADRSGQNLWPLMSEGAPSRHRRIYHAECNWQAARAIRTPTWKLICNIDSWVYDRPQFELYHLGEDPQETTNLAEKEPELTKELYGELLAWLEKQLGTQVDPIKETLTTVGLPATARLERTMATWNMTWSDWLQNPDLSRLPLAYHPKVGTFKGV